MGYYVGKKAALLPALLCSLFLVYVTILKPEVVDTIGQDLKNLDI